MFIAEVLVKVGSSPKDGDASGSAVSHAASTRCFCLPCCDRLLSVALLTVKSFFPTCRYHFSLCPCN